MILMGIMFGVPAIALAAPASVDLGTSKLIARAKEANMEAYRDFIKKGGKIYKTADNRSFYLFLSPSEDAPIVVSLHGRAGWAFADYAAWSMALGRKGFGLLSLQWWFGVGDEIKDYYQPQELYDVIAKALQKRGLTQRKILLHGFSRAAGNVYGMAALDRYSQNNYFSLIVANAGGAAPDFPINRAIDLEQLGQKPFSKTHWILFCGVQDTNPEKSGCEAMYRTKLWIEKNGGTVHLFIQDMKAGHGGFHRNPDNVEKVLSFFEKFNR